jgi:hypothetical protein
VALLVVQHFAPTANENPLHAEFFADVRSPDTLLAAFLTCAATSQAKAHGETAPVAGEPVVNVAFQCQISSSGTRHFPAQAMPARLRRAPAFIG